MSTFHSIGIIGAGNMGSCLIGGLIHQGYPENHLWVAESQAENLAKLRNQWAVNTTTNASEIVSKVDTLILAVKPQTMKSLIQSIANVFDASKTLLMSIAAGITTQQIQRWLAKPASIVRAMPNTPALYGYGITGLYATENVSSSCQQQANDLMQIFGQTVWLESEMLLDVVTALSGSGPAYFFYMLEGFIQAATTLGLPEDIAIKLTYQTALGSAYMAQHANESIESLRAKVTSPGGTTEQGIKVLKDAKLAALLLNTLSQATNRCKSLSEEYD